MPNRVPVSSADFIRNIGHWQNEALQRPISITHHGRERLVLAAADQFRSASDLENERDRRDALTGFRAAHMALLENIDEGFIQFDAHLRVTELNRASEAFLARARDDLVGLSVLDLFAGAPASVWRHHLMRAQRLRKSETFETGAFENSHVSVRAYPMGESVCALFGNITELKALRQEHEEGAALTTAMGLHPSAAILKLDARGRIESVSEHFSELFGFSESEVIGFRFPDLVASVQRRALTQTLERVLSGGDCEKLDLTIMAKRGDEVRGEIAFAAIRTDFAASGVIGLWISSGEGVRRGVQMASGSLAHHQ